MKSQGNEPVPLEVLRIVELIHTLETQRFFMFMASHINTCDKCNRLDGGLMTLAEIRRMFPYLKEWSDAIWLPRVHPNCRCILILWEIETLTRRDRRFIENWLMKQDSCHVHTAEITCLIA